MACLYEVVIPWTDAVIEFVEPDANTAINESPAANA